MISMTGISFFIAHRGNVPGCPENTTDPQLIVKCHELNRPVWVMAQDLSRTEVAKLINYGVDGIIADLPA
jgi:hypothetical protein